MRMQTPADVVLNAIRQGENASGDSVIKPTPLMRLPLLKVRWLANFTLRQHTPQSSWYTSTSSAMPIQLGLTLTEDGVDETIYFEQAAPEDATWSIKLAVNEPYSDGDEFQVWFGTLNRPAPADRIDVAVKLARSNHVSAPTLLADEAAHYAELQGLQDSGYIPVSYGHFTYHSGSWSQYQPGFLASVLVLEANTAWKPLIDTPGVTTNWAFLPFAVRRNILQAYVALHSHGFIHPYYNLSGEHVLKSDEPEDSPDDQSIRIISLHSTRHQDCPHRAITMEDLDIGGYMPNDGRLCEGMEKICLRLVIHRPRLEDETPYRMAKRA
ncbi:hypothetical protein FA95DRAFT_653270 [Auriscalpium vulgare]|uniref:Uncharacterized protein n=1 Tax=Auriscalpium vulgare TaxID=40419 RepID=A0ACB8RDX6_9AGAM|nr:hypothetical protein FA95DRAFT_653270 [Auriscalpium vulgare]